MVYIFVALGCVVFLEYLFSSSLPQCQYQKLLLPTLYVYSTCDLLKVFNIIVISFSVCIVFFKIYGRTILLSSNCITYGCGISFNLHCLFFHCLSIFALILNTKPQKRYHDMDGQIRLQ